MQASSWITMIVIMGLVWGGFLVLLTKAMRAESKKEHD
jgi:LPS O-antigen subunit length determinant protein (WzzB/FepE family)